LILTPADLAIADSQGLWPPDLSPNQLAIADRLIAQFLVQSCFPGALSCCQWAMADVLPDNLPPTPWDAKALAAQETDLGDRLQVLNQATSTDLLSLTRLVGLDSQQDLAGGKFVGVNLSGIDLSGANLANSNFRGAILTDADLSGANLAGSSLRGADLSGAYLEGANLTQVDFRKASLALTNMIGADLTGANLHGTALNNANWSRANLNLAQIGDNAGLSQTQQANLIERGAKLSAEFGQEMLG
jgi:uncharacterized protein YjbI with pentapeptide repeats